MPPSTATAPAAAAADPALADDPRVTRDAYFGTSQIEAAAILEGGRFLPRHGEEQYLGTGVYFFDDGPEDAVRWAQQRSPREWAVLRCRVRFGRCLDLHTRTGGDLLTRLAEGLRAARGEPVREADAIKLLARFTAIDTVRAVHRRPKLSRASGGGSSPGRLSLSFAPTPTPAPAAATATSRTPSAGGQTALQSIICVRNLTHIEHVQTFRIGS